MMGSYGGFRDMTAINCRLPRRSIECRPFGGMIGGRCGGVEGNGGRDPERFDFPTEPVEDYSAELTKPVRGCGSGIPKEYGKALGMESGRSRTDPRVN